MAYQSVGSCRFFVNVFEWMHSLGLITHEGEFGINSHFTTSATNLKFFNLGNGNNDHKLLPKFGNIPYNQVMGEQSFIAILGHNLYEANSEIQFESGGNNNVANDVIGKVNWGAASINGRLKPNYNGLSIATCNLEDWDQTDNANKVIFSSGIWGSSDQSPYSNGGVQLGAIIIGTYYEINAPDLSLTMSRDYGGTKEFTTYNGSSMSNTMWHSAPKWGSAGAWELYDPRSPLSTHKLSRSARRSWQLKFSYMDDGDLWGPNQMTSTSIGDVLSDSEVDLHGEDLYNSANFEYNILNDDNFFSQVWHRTLGMTLPMIFQPDKDRNSPDQFAIVKGVPNSLKATQSSPNTYDISLSLEEVF